MTVTPVTIQILGDGGIENTTRDVWFSHYGPIVNLPQLGWNESVAYAAKDANTNNTKVLAQWLAMGQAQSMDEFIQAHKTYNAMPWVNTISTSSDGRAVYLDNSNVGALSDASIAAWRERLATTPHLTQAYLGKGLVILDGSTARDEWLTGNGAPVAGTTPFEQRPLIESSNYVFNSNDSYWLSDPKQPATGFSPLYGPVMTPRSIRTRMNIHLLDGIPPFDFRGTDGKFSVAEIQSALFDNSGLAAHLLKPELIARCQSKPEVVIDGQTVDLSAACAVLASWDNRYDIQSQGAVLFREWLTYYDYHATQFAGDLFSQNFDPAKPALTPVGLSESDQVLHALGQAVLRLTANGIDLDEMLGELQLGHRSHRAIAIHGGNRYEGIANLQVVADFNDSPIFSGSNQLVPGSRYLTESGYNIAHGSSFIMTLSYTDEGPMAEAIMSYSQSGAPKSPHFVDQTVLYRDKAWRPVLYKREAIEANIIHRQRVQSQ
jgi:acyl-homoserine-lactone acylase